MLFHYIAAWTVYGRLVDNGNEFFIRPAYSTTGQQGMHDTARPTTRPTTRHTVLTSYSPTEDVSLEEALIPDYLGLPVCRQILFIGKVSCVACARVRVRLACVVACVVSR